MLAYVKFLYKADILLVILNYTKLDVCLLQVIHYVLDNVLPGNYIEKHKAVEQLLYLVTVYTSLNKFLTIVDIVLCNNC